MKNWYKKLLKQTMRLNPFLKSRKSQIKRSGYGQSARQQAFDLFKNGERPAKIFKAKLIPVKKQTLFRYFEDWKQEKKIPSNSGIRKLRKQLPELSDHITKVLAHKLNIPESEVILQWSKPWGLKQMLTGKWPPKNFDEVHSQIEQRLTAGLDVVRLAEQCTNYPKQFGKLLIEVAMLKEGTKLEITKENGRCNCKNIS
jgi:hypothetical protein